MATKYLAKFDSLSQLIAHAPDNGGAAGVGVVDGQVFVNEGGVAVPVGAPALVSLTAAVTLDPATHANRPLVVNNAAGFAITLSAATGSGYRYRLIIGTALATGDVTVTAPSGSVLKGVAHVGDSGDSSAGTADIFVAGASDEVFTFDQSAGGGAVGDSLEVEDIAEGVFRVVGVIQAQPDPATPFSSAA